MQHGGGGWSAKVFFAFSAKSVTEKNNSRVDCAEAGKKTVQAPLRQAQRPTLRQAQRSVKTADLEIRGEDFCLPLVALQSCPQLSYRQRLTAIAL